MRTDDGKVMLVSPTLTYLSELISDKRFLPPKQKRGSDLSSLSLSLFVTIQSFRSAIQASVSVVLRTDRDPVAGVEQRIDEKHNETGCVMKVILCTK